MKHVNNTVRHLLEDDKHFRGLERRARESPADKVLGARLERAYYSQRNYIEARRTRLAYDPNMILVAKSKPLRDNPASCAVLYLKSLRNGRQEWAVWLYDASKDSRYWGSYPNNFDRALRLFWDKAENGGLAAGSQNLDLLPDGYPSDFGIYRAL